MNELGMKKAPAAGRKSRPGKLLAAAGLAALALALRQRRAEQRLLQWLARLPVAGPWLRQAEIGRWATLLASLLTHRVPLLQALGLSSKSLRLDDDRARLALLHDVQAQFSTKVKNGLYQVRISIPCG